MGAAAVSARFLVLGALLAASDGGVSFRDLADYPEVTVQGGDAACLFAVASELQADVNKEPLSKRGSKLSDFEIFVIRSGEKCIVEISPRTKAKGGGVQYWVESGKVVTRMIAK